MSLIVDIKETSKGPTLKLTVAIKLYGDAKEEKIAASRETSKVFNIDDLADTSIIISCPKTYVGSSTVSVPYTMSILTSKKTLANDAQIKINVTCVELNYSKSWICSEHLTESHIGKINANRKIWTQYVVIFHSIVFEIRMNVQKLHKPSFIKLYEDSDLTDFHLSTPDGTVAVHKLCLAAHSVVFKTMFAGNWKETNENVLEMKGYSLNTVKHMKDFLYIGTLPENYDDLCSLMTLAVQYCIVDLKAECIWKLAETMTPENLYSVHEFACKNDLPELTYALMALTADDVVNRSHESKKKESEKIKQTE